VILNEVAEDLQGLNSLGTDVVGTVELEDGEGDEAEVGLVGKLDTEGLQRDGRVNVKVNNRGTLNLATERGVSELGEEYPTDLHISLVNEGELEDNANAISKRDKVDGSIGTKLELEVAKVRRLLLVKLGEEIVKYTTECNALKLGEELNNLLLLTKPSLLINRDSQVITTLSLRVNECTESSINSSLRAMVLDLLVTREIKRNDNLVKVVLVHLNEEDRTIEVVELDLKRLRLVITITERGKINVRYECTCDVV
jgi:hypothetical protein